MNKILSILNIEFLVKDDAFKNWRMILFLSFLALIMIASGHSASNTNVLSLLFKPEDGYLPLLLLVRTIKKHADTESLMLVTTILYSLCKNAIISG
jgi:hypothetical protein